MFVETVTISKAIAYKKPPSNLAASSFWKFTLKNMTQRALGKFLLDSSDFNRTLSLRSQACQENSSCYAKSSLLNTLAGLYGFHAEAFVALASSQVECLTTFYSGVFGIMPTPNTPAYAEFRLNGLRLALFTPNENNTAEFVANSSGPMSLCIEVNDLASAIAHLKALGHAPPGEIMHTSHGQEIYAYDPDGNRLILHQS